MKYAQPIAGHGLLLALFIALSGCTPRTVKIAETGEPGRMSDYGVLLQRVVVDDCIDTEKLVEGRSLLDRYLALVAQTGPASTPEQFPDKDHQLAYLINCHNAMVLRSLVALAGDGSIPQKLPYNFENRFQFVIDGADRTAGDLASEVILLAGTDWRARLALYTARMDGPPLPRRPLLGDMLDAQLDNVTRNALKSERVVRIDHGEIKRILLWRGLFEVHDQLITNYESRLHTSGATMLNVLLEWADRFQRETLNSAVGYVIEAMPEDRRVNAVGTLANVATSKMPVAGRRSMPF